MKHRHDPREQDNALQHEAEHERPHKKSSALFYLVILFAAAFVLLLMSYFMQQRSNEAVISGLKDTSISAVQSLDNLVNDNAALRQQVDELERQVAALSAAQAELDSTRQAQSGQLAAQEKQLAAMDWLWRIQRLYGRGAYEAANAMIAEFEASGLVPALPATATADPAGRSPAEQYRSILDALR